MNKTESIESWDFVAWCKSNPLAAVLAATILGTFFWFFGGVHLFVNGAETTADWAQKAWNPEQDQEHSWIVPFVFIGLIIYHWEELVKAPKRGSNLGLVFAGIGILSFVVSTRTLEPRMALISLPFLFYGSALYVWGKDVARIMLFPCAFLVFLIPFGVVQQATFKGQFIITYTVSFLANLVGIHNQALGTTISGQNGGFHFEVAEGCSGIHSIIAITMLTSIYMHLAESQLWKKGVVLVCSVIFAIIGNIGRIFTILLVAKLFNADIAGGKYHTISGYLIYPFAILAMIGLSSLLNIDAGHKERETAPGEDTKSPTPSSSSHRRRRSRDREKTHEYDY